MLKFQGVEDERTYYVNPHQVTMVSAQLVNDVESTESCQIYFAGHYISVKGSAAEAQLRICNRLP